MTKLLYFTASWCNPCKAMKPIVAQLEAAGLKVEMIDVEKAKAEDNTYGVTSIPTFIVLKDEKEVARATGAMPKAKLEALINA